MPSFIPSLDAGKPGPVEDELPRPPPLPSIALAEIEPAAELWGFVERVTNYGAYVNVGAEVQGFLHIKEVPGRQPVSKRVCYEKAESWLSSSSASCTKTCCDRG